MFHITILFLSAKKKEKPRKKKKRTNLQNKFKCRLSRSRICTTTIQEYPKPCSSRRLLLAIILQKLRSGSLGGDWDEHREETWGWTPRQAEHHLPTRCCQLTYTAAIALMMMTRDPYFCPQEFVVEGLASVNEKLLFKTNTHAAYWVFSKSFHCRVGLKNCTKDIRRSSVFTQHWPKELKAVGFHYQRNNISCQATAAKNWSIKIVAWQHVVKTYCLLGRKEIARLKHHSQTLLAGPITDLKKANNSQAEMEIN